MADSAHSCVVNDYGRERAPKSRGVPTSLLDMAPRDPSPHRSTGPAAGLCETCVHRREVSNTRGSVFSLCLLSRTDPAYPRYPRLPVLECAGYESIAP
jgi:hypothetical protein